MSVTRPHGPIVLLTDFGTQDGYAGILKGVIAGISPSTPVIDLSHEIPPQDIRSAKFLLENSYNFFPAGSIFVCIVDPRVGTERRALVVRTQKHFFVGPDNGLLTPILDLGEIFFLNRPEYWLPSCSNTFHGRDIFAPVAAYLAKGVSPKDMGEPVADPIRLSPPLPSWEGNAWSGQIIYVDHFGNLITNLPLSAKERFGKDQLLSFVLEDGSIWPLVETYAHVPIGHRCGIPGSFGYYELSINCGNAAVVSGYSLGTKVLLQTTIL